MTKEKHKEQKPAPPPAEQPNPGHTTPPKEDSGNYLALGIGLGLCFGVVFGQLVFKNLGTGIAVGMCLGVVFGTAMKKRK